MRSHHLVDTHIWIWYAQGDHRRLNQHAAKALQSLDEQENAYLSIMSIWELGMLAATQRLVLDMPAQEWVTRFFERTRFQALGLEIPVTLDAGQLPGEIHGDPVDRILVATARHHDLILLSADKHVLRYGRQGHVRVCSVSDL